MSTEDYQRAQEENLRSPKNRFLGIFCHANEVNDHWGPNWSFGCGVIFFSVLVGIWTIFDTVTMSLLINRTFSRMAHILVLSKMVFRYNCYNCDDYCNAFSLSNEFQKSHNCILYVNCKFNYQYSFFHLLHYLFL